MTNSCVSCLVTIIITISLHFSTSSYTLPARFSLNDSPTELLKSILHYCFESLLRSRRNCQSDCIPLNPRSTSQTRLVESSDAGASVMKEKHDRRGTRRARSCPTCTPAFINQPAEKSSAEVKMLFIALVLRLL